MNSSASTLSIAIDDVVGGGRFPKKCDEKNRQPN